VRRLALPRHLPGHVDPVERSAADEALILFTSGTTSAPRAVVHTHGNVPVFLDHVGAVVADLPHGSYLAETPQQIFYALLLDATCHVVHGVGEARMRATLELLSTGRIEAWFGSPWTWVRWLERGLPVPDGLRSVLLGSAPVTRPFLRRLLDAVPSDATVRCLYGLSEAGPVCAVDGPQKVGWTGEGDLVGRPLPGVDLRLTDDGDVLVRTDALAARYLGHGPVGPWLDTGDLGVLTDDGLALQGRRKDMIVRHGINLYPGVLEPPLLDVLSDAALVGVYDHEREDERVILVHVGPLARGVDALLGVAAPDHTLRIDALPRAGRQHKVDKASLQTLARERFSIP
jgi:acyl-CoA synthetase (AMP-forming)/AMP-acid ligase II